MRFIGILVLACSLSACSDGLFVVVDGGPDVALGDASEDADVLPDAVTPDATPDAQPDGDACVCVGVTPCCDGCLARNVGVACDDGLACASDSTCSADGMCAGGDPVACPPPAVPACQAAACSEPGGCATTSIREGLACDDGNAATYDDVCSGGACVGTPCECAPGSGPCCDGCHIRPASFKCVDHGPIEARCTGAYDIVIPNCGGTPSVELTIGDRYCSGSSVACNGAAVSADEYTSGTCGQLMDDGMGSMPTNPLRCMPVAGSPLVNECRRCL